MPITWKEYRGKKYLYADYRGLKTEPEMLGLLEQIAQSVKSAPGKVMLLSDFTGTAVTSGFLNRGKTLGKEVFAVKFQKSAMLGVTGVKNILLQAYLTFTGDKATRPMPSEADALSWFAE